MSSVVRGNYAGMSISSTSSGSSNSTTTTTDGPPSSLKRRGQAENNSVETETPQATDSNKKVKQDHWGTTNSLMYESVLEESEDLCKAASEAQALGRLDKASSYLLLLHARLMGLGKLLDKSLLLRQGASSSLASDATQEVSPRPPQVSPKTDESKTLPLGNNSGDPTINTHNTSVPHSTPGISQSHQQSANIVAVQQLFLQMLPRHIQLDQPLLQHLVQAATEFQQKRSKTSSDLSTNVATTATAAAAATTTVAFSQSEKQDIQKHLENGKSPTEIANIVNRKLPQVKAFIRNHKTKSKIEAELSFTPSVPPPMNITGTRQAVSDTTGNNNDMQADSLKNPPPNTMTGSNISSATTTVPQATYNVRQLLGQQDSGDT